MPAKHPEDLRLVAVAMARMVGPEQAADDLGLDVRTVKSWVAATPPRSEISDDEHAWQAAERVALYRNLRALARGEVKDTIRLNNLAGTARDKLFRWASRREAGNAEQPPETWRRRAEIWREEAPDYWHMPAHNSANEADREASDYQAAKRLHEYYRACRQELVRRVDADARAKADGQEAPDELEDDPSDPLVSHAIGDAGFYYLLRHAADTKPPDTTSPYINHWDAPGIGKVNPDELDDDGYRAHVRKVLALAQVEADAWWPLHEAALAAARAKAEEEAARPSVVPEQAPEPSDAEPVPLRPPQRIERPVQPSPMVLDVGYEDHDRGWHPYERREF